MNSHLTDQDVNAMLAAHDAGALWAESLKPGDEFRGARPEAMTRYADERLIRLFVSSALDVLEALRVVTGPDGRILEVRR